MTDISLPPLLASLIIVASLSRHVDCMCETLQSHFSGSNILFFRVLMLRRKASRTQTELRVEYSHMVNEALEMVNAEFPKDTSGGAIPSISTGAQDQP